MESVAEGRRGDGVARRRNMPRAGGHCQRATGLPWRLYTAGAPGHCDGSDSTVEFPALALPRLPSRPAGVRR
jgi:hypothetical protein